MPIIDVHVHTDVGKSLDDFAVQIAIAEQFDTVLVTYAIRPVADATRYAFPTAEFCARSNDETYELMQRYPQRVRGFCYVNPYHADAAAAELERRLSEQHFVGLKLWHALPCDDDRVDRMVEICEHYRVPALQHTWLKAGGLGYGESPPEMVADLARRHPTRPSSRPMRVVTTSTALRYSAVRQTSCSISQATSAMPTACIYLSTTLGQSA